MDDPNADPEVLRDSLQFLAKVNSRAGYTRATLCHLKGFARRWKPGQTIRMIDLATGSADIPRAILRWSRAAGFDVKIVGVDRHATTALAAAAQSDPDLTIIQCDVLAMPFEPGSFDYAVTGLFLHHLDDDQAVEVLKIMDRLSTRGIIAADILRHRRLYWWIKLFTIFSNPMVRHDALISVGQSFTRPEVLSLRQRAGLDYTQYFGHFGHRFVLAGEKL
jgi:SAM-dependent methyltransferase